MNIITSLLRGLGSKQAAQGDYPGTWLPANGSESGVSQANLLEANREWVFVAVDKVASAVAGIRFKVMRYTRNGDDQEVFVARRPKAGSARVPSRLPVPAPADRGLEQGGDHARLRERSMSELPSS